MADKWPFWILSLEIFQDASSPETLQLFYSNGVVILGPMIFRERRKRTEFAEYTMWNGTAYFKV